jgi:hypothetical protein
MWWRKPWCCSTFRRPCENPQDLPFSIRVRRITEAGRVVPVFTFEFRAVARADMAAFREARGRMSVPVSIGGFHGIDYCPFCGVGLARYYRSRLDRLAEELAPAGPDLIA